jgi:ketosteroid isomerase-like protein
MSQENVEIVRRAFEAWNQGGADSAKRFWAEDYEFHDPPNFPDPRVVRGRDAVADHLKDQTSVLGDLKVTIVDVRARDETVVVRLEGTAHGAESGVDVPAEATQVFEVAAGRLQCARMFLTWEEALEAAGLSE